MLTQELDQETEFYLADILAQERTTSDELIRSLIRDRWLALRHRLPANDLVQPPLTPSQPVSLSQRPKNSKQTIADFIRRKNQRSV